MTLKLNGSLWPRICKKVRENRVVTLLLIIVLVVVAGRFGYRMWIVHKIKDCNLLTQPGLSDMLPSVAGQKILIFAPHEDDETLGCGGYIQKAVAAGAQVKVVLVTNGDYPEIDVVMFQRKLKMHPDEFIKLGYQRQRETLKALQYLGLPNKAVTFLGYPNHYVKAMTLPSHWLPSDPITSIRTKTSCSPYKNSLTPHAIYCGQSFLNDVETLLLNEHPDIIITIHPNDVHHDHWPVYTVVKYALEELAARGEPFTSKCLLWTYLIHRDSWPEPRGYWPKLNMEPPSSLVKIGNTKWVSVPLTLLETQRKRKAISFYKTQGGSIDPLLKAFARSTELFGYVPVNRWPSGNHIPGSAVVIEDPVADLMRSAMNPHGDITSVLMKRNKDRLAFDVITYKAAASNITYHVTLHAGGVSPANRIIAKYDWNSKGISGLVMQNGELRRPNSSDMQVSTSGRITKLEVPWPLQDESTKFFMVHAWTTLGPKVIDQTATETFVLVDN